MKPRLLVAVVVVLSVALVAQACTGQLSEQTDATSSARDARSHDVRDAAPADVSDADSPNDSDADAFDADATDAADVDAHDTEPESVDPVGRWQSFFNEPSAANNFSDNTLRDRLVRYIDGAVAGSEIRAHVTRLSSAGSIQVVVDALVAAHDRGVDIWMVHNANSPVFPALENRLGARYVHCSTPSAENNSGCLSNLDNGTHHMKNWYFSHVELGSNVYKHLVVTTSYNITVGQSRAFNDMLAVSGNKALYDAHVAVYEDYLHQRKTDDRHSQPGGRIFVPTAATYTAEFSPQKNGDMVADALARISQFEEGCELRVANLNVTRSAILRQLERIHALGCKVRVITGTRLTEANETRLESAGIRTRQVEFVRNNRTITLHNKMMVYNGYYDSPVDQHRKNDRVWVWTGSQNFTARPLRYRDDVFVGISRGGVFSNYRDHFEVIWHAGSL